MSSRPVISISARKRGTTRFLIGSTPSTCRASSSSRILRAPRSAVIAVPATPATTTAVTKGANSRIEASTKKPPRRAGAREGRDLADRGERKKAAEPVEGTEQRKEVGRLQPRGAEAEGDGRHQQ